MKKQLESVTLIYYKNKGYKMKKTLQLSLSVALVLGVSSVFASEAYSPIAYGAKARGMGGLGIGFVHGAESSFSNPALIAYLPKDEVSLGFTYMSSKNSLGGDATDMTLGSEPSLISYAAMSNTITESISIGATLANLSSLNSSINPDDGGTVALSELSKTRVAIPVTYNIVGFSVGIAPILEQQTFSSLYSLAATPSVAFGFDLGLAYHLDDLGLMIAADYKSKIKHKHMAEDGNFDFNTPSEMGIGLSWDIFNSGHSIGFDYKQTKASDVIKVTGEDLELEDINSFALGYEYQAKDWAARVGYRYISDLYDFAKVDELLLILPYNTTSHFSLGGSYTFNDTVSGDLALVYAMDNHDYTNDGDTITMKNNQTSLTVGLNYHF